MMKNSVKLGIWLTNPPQYLKGHNPSTAICEGGLDMAAHGWVQLDSRTVELTFEIPSIEVMTLRTVGALKELIETTRAEAHIKVQELEKQINQILSIEMSPQRNSDEVVEDDDGIPF